MTDNTTDKARAKNTFRYREYCWDDKNVQTYTKRAVRSGVKTGIKAHKAKIIVKKMKVPVTIAATKSFTKVAVLSVIGNRFKITFR